MTDTRYLSGWKDLMAFTGLSEGELRRAAAAGEFSALPRKRRYRGRVRFACAEVKAWYRAQYGQDPPGAERAKEVAR